MLIEVIDSKIFELATTIHSGYLTYFFATITYSAGYMVVILVSILTVIAFFIHKHTRRVVPFIVSILGTSASVYLMKIIFDLERPARAIYVESTPSFPSGHSAIAIALYGFLVMVAWKHDNHHLKNPLIICLSILILLVGISRLYLGVHYFADVITGYMIGFIWLFFTNKYYKKTI